MPHKLYIRGLYGGTNFVSFKIMGTQRLFSVKYLFGETNIA